jgi:hypothetical protein
VDADAVRLDTKKGEIYFQAKKGRLVDLGKLHESIWATRLSGGTGMGMNWIDVTAVGTVVVDKDRTILKVAGSPELFVLKEGPAPLPFARLLAEAKRGETRVSVTGRVEGWHGHFPPFLRAVPKKPWTIRVAEFQPAGPGKSTR